MNITFLGGGNMANALIGGLLKEGFDPNKLTVIDPNEEARTRLSSTYTVNCIASSEALDSISDVLVLATKPQQMQAAVLPLITKISNSLILSIAAGLDLSTLSRFLNGHRQIVRCMPNTPALVRAGVTGLCALPEVNIEGRNQAELIMKAVGKTLWLDNEQMMDALTAISGSGPAYIFLFMEAFQKAACDFGFTPEQSSQLTMETFLGATMLAAQSSESVSMLRERVTSKGGTTEAALNTMHEKAVKEGIIAGMNAAKARSQALARQLGTE